MNKGDVPITLKLYAADAATAINGGTAFANEGEEKNGVAHWLSLPWQSFLSSRAKRGSCPSPSSVPSDASPGQHVAGLVVEAVPGGGRASQLKRRTAFTVNVVRRAGVAVLIDVPGPHAAGLEITGICLRQQDDDHGGDLRDSPCATRATSSCEAKAPW